MNLASNLAKQTQEVFLDGTWIATNFKKELSEVDWQTATAKVSTLNTIAALAFHINYYLAGVNNVFAGGTLDIRDKYSFDVPSISNTHEWDTLRNEFYNQAEKFVAHVDAMKEDSFSQGFAGGKYGSNFRNIVGMIEHAYYHLGQIVIIKKLIKAGLT